MVDVADHGTDDEYVAYVGARLPPLKRLAFLLCGDKHRADDLVQESVMKLYLRWRSARDADNLDRYVRAIVVRTHIDDTRRPWFRVRLFGAMPEQRVSESRDVESATALRTALSRLPAASAPCSCCASCATSRSTRSVKCWAVRPAPSRARPRTALRSCDRSSKSATSHRSRRRSDDEYQ